MSADFRQHAVAMFAEPLFAAHDKTSFEIYLYAGVAAEDTATERFRSLSDHWRSTIGLSDAKLAELIRADQIDVLVDLAGHSAGNRLLTFARRPAPVQVAYLLGHGYTTGFVTFGHFGRTERLNEDVIATWARILHAVPQSRLILDNRPFQEAAFRDLFLARFAAEVLSREYPALAEKMFVRTAILDWHSRTLETVSDNVPESDRSQIAASF